MAKNSYLSSEDARAYLHQQHGINRSAGTFDRWHSDGTLPASRRDSRFRQYSREHLDEFAQRHFRNSTPDQEAIPMARVTRKNTFTNPRFGKSDAGAQDTERRSPAALAKGGQDRMFAEQNADTARPGKTGHDTVRKGAGKISALGGYGTPKGKSKVGEAGVAAPGRTGNATGSRPRPSATDFSTEGPKRFR
jgi:hypothetical protein